MTLDRVAMSAAEDHRLDAPARSHNRSNLDGSAPVASIKERLRVGLLSPYTGTNLGDQALQAACIANLRAHLPKVQLTGIYLNPARTAALHHIETFPITGLAVSFYANRAELFGPVPAPAPASVQQPAAESESEQSSFRQFLKRIPGVRSAVLMLRATAAGILNIVTELRWLVRSWRKVGELDLVIVAGGGQLDDEWGGAWGQPYVLLRWALIARLRRKPFAVASVGVGYLNKRLSRWLFARALSLADYVTCRDRGSAVAVAKQLGRPEPAVVFDIAGSISNEAGPLDAMFGDDAEIALSPIAFGRSGSWPTEAHGIYESYIERLGEFVRAVLRAGRRIVIFTTSGSDGAAVADLMTKLEGDPELLPQVRIVRPSTVDGMFELLADCSVVVASRLHGVMISHLAGKPVLAISFDRKVDAHMEQYEQQRFCVDLGTFTVADLQTRFQRLLTEAPEIRVSVRATRERHGRDLQRQYETLAALAASSRSAAA